MAARLTKRQSNLHRESIRVSMLINRLTDHILGKVDLSQTQIRAIEVLLKKAMPDLKAVEVSGDAENPLIFNLPIEYVEPATTEETRTVN